MKRGTPREADSAPVDRSAHDDFPIVGIGASAGGLAAFEAFFSAMPAATESGMAFVLVQHLAPDHKSILSSLVERYTKMRVFEVEDGMAVSPNCAYIIPPNRDMALLNGCLHLFEPSAPRGQRLTIDFFFRSLAQDRRERAICIILSGTGSDGSLGLRAIKGEGGMAMAQSPGSTEYDGMPNSAIATGLVDYVLPPADMPAQLIAFVTHAYEKPSSIAVAASPKHEEALKKILVLLRAHTGHDFSLYKQSTISRRVERRMAVHQIRLIDEYVRYVQHTPSEAEALFRDLLIGVTSFFRDPRVFSVLEEMTIHRLVAGAPPGSWIRVWVPGCSTGEEAYSIAMLFEEQRDMLMRSCRLQIFATDIDRHAIEQARAGVFLASSAADIPSQRLMRFFTMESDGGRFRVHKAVRDMLVFSEQDVIRDPPFSRLDLISCRNVLIYMGGELQKKLMPLFHYSLNPGGTLLLGASETIGDFIDLFEPIDRTARLYRKKASAAGGHQKLPERSFTPVAAPMGMTPSSRARKPGLRELTETTLLQRYAPAAVLVDQNGEILYLHGRTGRFLEMAPGEPGTNILTMAREGLRSALGSALRLAVASNERARHDDIRVRSDDGMITISCTVEPVPGASRAPDEGGVFLVTLEQTPDVAPSPPSVGAPAVSGQPVAIGDDAAKRIATLENELKTKEEHLHAANEELQTSNEELRSSNEEMQSVNEELQSTNEELETSKEELQSVNEELTTVNAELQAKVSDLSRANNDMVNLLSGTGIGTIFVDHQLRIVRFTPTVTQIINLIQGDVGRPVGHIVSNMIGYDGLVADLHAVLATLEPKEIEVQTHAGAWYLLRIRPYRTLENVIEGAVITFTDVTEMKKIREGMKESATLRRLAVVVRDANDAITVQDRDGRILAWNPAAVKVYGWTETEALAMNIADIMPPNRRGEQKRILDQLQNAELLEPFHTQRVTKDGRIVDITLTATALVDESGAVYGVATTERHGD